MGFSKIDESRNEFMLHGPLSRQGYDWWWHSLTGINKKTGEEKPFFIEFFTCNPALAEDEPVFGQLPENKAKGKKPSYLMVNVGCWGENARQLHRFFAWKDVTIRQTPMSVMADNCLLTNNVIKGSVHVSPADVKAHPEWMCQAGEMIFDLKAEKIVPFNVGYGASKLFRSLNAFEMFWHASGIKTKYEGKIILDGEEYEVTPDTCYGYADKNWGKDFTTPWVWISSNNLYSRKYDKKLENSVFDIGGGRPGVFGIHLPRQLLSAFWYEGKEYEFNFSKFWTFTRTQFDCGEENSIIRWFVRQQNWTHIMETELECDKKDMLLIQYEAPTGEKRHNNLWNGGNGHGTVRLYRKKLFGKSELMDDIAVKNAGCEYGEMDPK